MTKVDIVEKIQTQIGISKKESSDLLESLFSLMKETLENGENIKLAGFGIFEIQQKKDRIGRNPQNGESIIIKSRRVLTFKPSAVLKDRINKKATK